MNKYKYAWNRKESNCQTTRGPSERTGQTAHNEGIRQGEARKKQETDEAQTHGAIAEIMMPGVLVKF